MINEVILASSSGIRLKILQDNGFDLLYKPELSDDELSAILSNIEGWIIRSGTRITKDHIRDAKKLGITLCKSEARELALAGSKIIRDANKQLKFKHPNFKEINNFSFCQFSGNITKKNNIALISSYYLYIILTIWMVL